MGQLMNVEQLVTWELAGETKVLGENLPQDTFVHQKSHMTWPGIEPGPPRWEAMARPKLMLSIDLEVKIRITLCSSEL
jgi:hypothetical protein